MFHNERISFRTTEYVKSTNLDLNENVFVYSTDNLTENPTEIRVRSHWTTGKFGHDHTLSTSGIIFHPTAVNFYPAGINFYPTEMMISHWDPSLTFCKL